MNVQPLKAKWLIRDVDGGWRALLQINGVIVLRSDPYGRKDDARALIARTKNCAGKALIHEED